MLEEVAWHLRRTRAHWHISQFGKGGFLRLPDAVFDITTRQKRVLAPVGS